LIIYPLVFFFILIFTILHEHKFIILTEKNKYFFFTFLLIFFSIYIGLRVEVGGDWGNYYENYFVALDVPISNYLKYHIFTKDPLFRLLNYIVIKLNGSYVLLNFILSLIFSFALLNFCFSKTKPFLLILLSLPYLINVVAMGYHRQAIAISMFMYGFNYLENKENSKYIFLVLIASLFHYTAFILVLFVLLNSNKLNIKNLIYVFIVSLLIIILAFDSIVILFVNYLSISYSSSGAYIRCLMNVLPGLIFLYYYKNEFLQIKNKILFKNLSILSIIFFVLLFISPSSAMIDRVSLYLIPFQIILWMNLIDIFKRENNSNHIIFYSIIFLYYLSMLIWIYFGKFSIWWFPYNNFIFMLID